jgi:hypothetical protein
MLLVWIAHPVVRECQGCRRCVVVSRLGALVRVRAAGVRAGGLQPAALPQQATVALLTSHARAVPRACFASHGDELSRAGGTIMR